MWKALGFMTAAALMWLSLPGCSGLMPRSADLTPEPIEVSLPRLTFEPGSEWYCRDTGWEQMCINLSGTAQAVHYAGHTYLVADFERVMVTPMTLEIGTHSFEVVRAR
jgi:hypothetical protein